MRFLRSACLLDPDKVSTLAIVLVAAGFHCAPIAVAEPPSSEPARPVSTSAAETNSAVPTGSFEQSLLPFLKKYCSECHGNGAHEGDFRYDRYADLDALKRDRYVWTKVLKL